VVGVVSEGFSASHSAGVHCDALWNRLCKSPGCSRNSCPEGML